MIVPFSLHSWLATTHGVLFGVGYLALLALALGAVAWLRPAELTPLGVTLTERQVGLLVTLAATAAWVAVVSGTWGLYPWFRAAGPGGPAAVLPGPPGALVLGPLGGRLQGVGRLGQRGRGHGRRAGPYRWRARLSEAQPRCAAGSPACSPWPWPAPPTRAPSAPCSPNWRR